MNIKLESPLMQHAALITPELHARIRELEAENDELKRCYHVMKLLHKASADNRSQLIQAVQECLEERIVSVNSDRIKKLELALQEIANWPTLSDWGYVSTDIEKYVQIAKDALAR